MKGIMLICCSIVIGIAAIPVLALSEPDGSQTPGAEVSNDVGSQAVEPYVAPSSVFVPDCSKQIASDAGKFMHTNYVIRNFTGTEPQSLEDLSMPAPEANPTPDDTFAEYPASLSCLYKMGPTYAGCVPTNNPAYNATGGSRAIAIVIAFDNPTAKADFNYFRSFFGLSAKTLKVVKVNTKSGYAGASCASTPYNSGWALESALDTQWSGAMAPGANIILVEACDNSYNQLMLAEQVAVQQLGSGTGGQVSNSWGSGEWATESTDWDWVFHNNGTWVPGKPVSFFFSAGDAGLGAAYPSSSPWVISAGGTTINRDASTAYFASESCWAGSGGGTSAFETYSCTWGSGSGPWTDFQYPLFEQSNRSTPDVSFDADPASGVWVFSAGYWYVVGGTSVSAPALAGIVNNSNNRLGNAPSLGGYWSNLENNLLYPQLFTNKEYITNFYDVTTGSNGASATVGWDYCTGVGSPRGKLGK